MSKVCQILIENLDFRNQLSTLELKIQLKIGPLRPKIILKHFINNSKKTLKKSRNRLFRSPKWTKMTPQISQNEQNFDPKSQFSRSFIDL